MSVLAFKALSYGAEQIPDKFFEKIPGGFFTPQEDKDIKQGRKDRKDKEDRERHRSEDRSDRRHSRRDRAPRTDYSGHSTYDDNTDYEREREQRKKERKRAKSMGRSSSRSMSRGRDNRRSRDLDGEYSDARDMAQPEQGVPFFPPPPTSEYKPQEYSSPPAQNTYRPSSAIPAYPYSPQVNTFSNFRDRRATLPSTPEHPTPVNSCPPLLMNRPPSSPSSFQFFPPPLLRNLSRGTPVSAAFSPSYEPPLAALLQRPPTNSPKPATAQAYPPQPFSGQHEVPRSAASRYTPGPGYAPSPPVNSAYPPPPADTNSSPYYPYNPSDYPPGNAGYAGSTITSPPPFERQRSNSQPPYVPGGNLPYQTYIPPSADQDVMTAYDQPPSRRGSTRPSREHRHRALSADSHSRSSKDHRRDSSRMSKVRERFDGMDLREKGLAATVGGALAGGLAGRQMGKSRLTVLVGAAAGAIGGRTIADKRSK
ncbi:hypothetical protein J1614_004575 [Plenodomus biglobosus]|nr:hypothetical protein J1614_004575 [Plenodomus biglobosus]